MLRDLACFEHYSSCAKHGDFASVSFVKMMQTYNSDVNSASGENWKEPPSATMSRKASFNDDSNKETLKVNKTCWH